MAESGRERELLIRAAEALEKEQSAFAERFVTVRMERAEWRRVLAPVVAAAIEVGRADLEQAVTVSTRTFDGYKEALERAIAAEAEVAKLRGLLAELFESTSGPYHDGIYERVRAELATEDVK